MAGRDFAFLRAAQKYLAFRKKTEKFPFNSTSSNTRTKADDADGYVLCLRAFLGNTYLIRRIRIHTQELLISNWDGKALEWDCNGGHLHTEEWVTDRCCPML